MANKTVLQIEGRFDPSQILNSLKQIRAEMGKAGAKDSLFSGVDKELENAKKLLTNFMASMSQGVSNSKDIDKLNKEFDNLCKSLAKASTGMKTVAGESKNFNVNGSEIAKLQKTLEQATEAKKKLEESAKAALKTQMQSLKLNEGQQKAILKEINDQAKLEEAIKKVGKAKEQTYNQKYQQYISSNSSAQNKVAEINTREGGNLYAAGLTEAVKNGETLIQTYERIKKLHADNNVQIQDEHTLLTQLRQDYKSIIDAAYNTTVGQPKGQITQYIYGHQALGSTDSNGNFNLNQTGNNIVNAVDYAGLAQQTQQIAAAQAELNRLNAQAAQDNQQYANTATQALDQVEEEQRQIAEEFHNIAEAQRDSMNAQEELNKTFDNLKDTVKRILSLSSALSGVKRVITETFRDVQRLDSAFKSIALVTNKTVSELWSSYGDYAEMANRLGQSTENAIKSSALFYQQGLDTAEALTLTEDTMKLATLSGQGFEEATRQMTAALRGFHMEMEQGSHITDVYSELAASAAADVHDIAYAMSKTASIASSAGMSFENTAAFLTNMIETTQEAPENIGTAMKTIIARFTELKENVSQADSEFDDLDYNKVDKALKSIGMNMKDTNGQFRNLDEIFLELSSKWSTLDRNTQRYIATTAAGSRQQSRFIAMMEDYGRTMELVETAQNSAGKSEEQFAKYADTLEYKVTALKNTWEQLRMSLIHADVFKNLIDGANGLLGKISKLDFKKVLLTAIPGAFIAKSFITQFINALKTSSNQLTTGIKQIANSITKKVSNTSQGIIGKALRKDQQEIENTKIKIQQLKQDLEALNNSPNKAQYSQLIVNTENEIAQLEQHLIDTGNRITQTTQNITNSLTSVCSAAAIGINMLFTGASWEDSFKVIGSMIAAQAVSLVATLMSTFITATIAAKKSGVGIGRALGIGIHEGLGSTGVGLIVVAISAAIAALVFAIGKAVKYFKSQHKSLEEQLKESEARLKELEKTERDLKSQAKESNEAVKNVNKLKDKYEELHNIAIKTTEEEEEYKEVIDQIREQYPQIITYYDEQNNKLEIAKDKWDAILKNAKELSKQDSAKAALASFGVLNEKVTRDQLKQQQTEKYQQNYNKDEVKNVLEDALNNFKGDELRSEVQRILHDNFNIDITDDDIRRLLPILENASGTKISKNWQIMPSNGKTYDKALTNSEMDMVMELLDFYDGNSNDIELLDNEQIKKQEEEIISAYLQNTTDKTEAINNYISNMITSSNLKEKYQTKTVESIKGVEDNYAKMVEQGFDLDILASLGVTDAESAEEWADKKDGKSLGKLVGLYNKAVKQKYELEQAELLSSKLTEKQEKLINDFMAVKNDLTGKELQKKILETSSYFGEDSELTRQYLNKVVNDGRQQYADKVKSFYGIDTSLFSQNELESLATQAEKMIKNLGRNVADSFSKESIKLKDKYNLNMSTFVNLTGADWSNVDLSNYEEFFIKLKKKVIEEQKCTPEEADEIVNSYKQMAQEVGALDYSTLSIDSLGDKVVETFKKKIENKKDITNAIKSQLENGVISFTESGVLEEKLKEVNMDAEKYLTFNSDGTIVLDADTLMKEYQGSEEYARQLVEAAKQANEAKIQQIRYEKAILDLKIAQLEIDKESIDKEKNPARYESIKTTIESSKEMSETLEGNMKILEEEINKYEEGSEEWNKLVNSIMAAQRELDFTDDIENITKKAEESAEKIVKAEKKVEEATKKLNEALFGQEYHKDALDLLYNYTVNLERLEKKAQDAKEALEDLGKTDNVDTLMETYLSNTHDSIVNREAQNRVLEQSITNRKAVLDNKLNEAIAEINAGGDRNLSSDISDYYTIVGDRLNVNHAAIDAAALPDDLKNYIHEQIQTINEEYNTMEENIDAIKDKEKELRDFQKSARDNYIKLEQKVIDTLKEKYEEEIKNNEDKNKALEEADNAYIEALKKNIDKQRKLRDEANSWDDLAEKQKKLSLMQRDTSGANAKEVKKLQEDVEKTQQDLLDKGVDRIVEELEELYKTYQETRELEIEYQKAVIDNAKLIKEANDLINSWNGPEDMYEFMMNNTKTLSEMSQTQIEAEKDTWEELFNSKTIYRAISEQKFSDAIKTQEVEIAKTVKETSEVLTQEADRSLGEIKTKVEEAIKSAEEALEEAIKNLEDIKKDEGEKSYSNQIKGTSPKLPEFNSKEQTYSIPTIMDVNNMPGAARNEYEKQFYPFQLLDKAILEYIDKIEQTKNMPGAAATVAGNAARNTLEETFKKLDARYDYNKKDSKFILKTLGKYSDDINYLNILQSLGFNAYASGGLVDYTGPAWVDGTPNKPEAFLSPEDTQNIGMAAKLLASLPIFNYGSANNAVSSNIGDTSIEIHINVDSLGSDYDVDQLVERVKNDIAEIARPTGTPVILNKR